MKQKFNKVQEVLFYFMPAALFLSYHPILSIGANETMNFEFSIAEIWLILFCLASMINIPEILKKLKKKYLFLSVLFPLYCLLSIIWTPNKIRAILTVGMLSLIWFAIINVIYLMVKTKRIKFEKFIRVMLLSTVFICIFCWLQCVFDLLGSSLEASKMCLGCTYVAFGFPHPNGLTIEPQFMGNLLLAPAFVALYYLLDQKQKIYSKRKILLITVFIISTLFLTFSRGAIYAFCFGALIEVGWFYYKKQKTNLLKTVSVICLSFIMTLTMQGIFAQVSPTNDTFLSGINKVINQLTLGKIDLGFKPEGQAVVTNLKTPANVLSRFASEPVMVDDMTDKIKHVLCSSNNDKDCQQTAAFDGYVEESTNVRLNLNGYGLAVWHNSLSTIIFGAGLGSAGTVMYEVFPDELGSPKEIVQNEYVTILLETGLVGVVLLVISIYGYARLVIKESQTNYLLAISLGAAYLITLCFFSGLPNALHLYLLPSVLLLGFQKPVSRKRKS